jgi:glycosyltransferase involved in cell wall biosynthesis
MRSSQDTLPLVSVLVPAFNAGPWVIEAIQSLLGQRYQRLEVIVVNDASRDDTLEKLASLRDPRLKVASNPENRGLIATLNHACALAQGEFLARMDADDRALPERLGKQVKTLMSEEDLAVLGTGIRFFSAEENWGHVTRAPLRHPAHSEDMQATLPFYSSLGHGSAMLRRKILDAIPTKDVFGNPALYDAAFPHAEDYELWSRLAKSGHKMRSLQEPLQEVRLHRSSVSQRENVKQREIADIIRAGWRKSLGLETSGENFLTHSRLGRLDLPEDPAFLDLTEKCLQELRDANEKTRLFDPRAWNKSLSLRWWQACHSVARRHPTIRTRAISSKWARGADPGGLRSAKFFMKTLLG